MRMKRSIKPHPERVALMKDPKVQEFIAEIGIKKFNELFPLRYHTNGDDPWESYEGERAGKGTIIYEPPDKLDQWRQRRTHEEDSRFIYRVGREPLKILDDGQEAFHVVRLEEGDRRIAFLTNPIWYKIGEEDWMCRTREEDQLKHAFMSLDTPSAFLLDRYWYYTTIENPGDVLERVRVEYNEEFAWTGHQYKSKLGVRHAIRGTEGRPPTGILIDFIICSNYFHPMNPWLFGPEKLIYFPQKDRYDVRFSGTEEEIVAFWNRMKELRRRWRRMVLSGKRDGRPIFVREDRPPVP